MDPLLVNLVYTLNPLFTSTTFFIRPLFYKSTGIYTNTHKVCKHTIRTFSVNPQTSVLFNLSAEHWKERQMDKEDGFTGAQILPKVLRFLHWNENSHDVGEKRLPHFLCSFSVYTQSSTFRNDPLQISCQWSSR